MVWKLTNFVQPLIAKPSKSTQTPLSVRRTVWQFKNFLCSVLSLQWRPTNKHPKVHGAGLKKEADFKYSSLWNSRSKRQKSYWALSITGLWEAKCVDGQLSAGRIIFTQSSAQVLQPLYAARCSVTASQLSDGPGSSPLFPQIIPPAVLFAFWLFANVPGAPLLRVPGRPGLFWQLWAGPPHPSVHSTGP